MATPILTRDRFNELLRYDPLTGNFVFLVARGGKPAGYLCKYRFATGYAGVRVEGTLYYAHRLAWFVMTGNWPKDQIDHINGIRDDNRFINLRESTNRQNTQNLHRAQKNNRQGLLGVHRIKNKQGFHSSIMVNGVIHKLGVFDSAEEAHVAYLKAKRDLHEFCSI